MEARRAFEEDEGEEGDEGSHQVHDEHGPAVHREQVAAREGGHGAEAHEHDDERDVELHRAHEAEELDEAGDAPVPEQRDRADEHEKCRGDEREEVALVRVEDDEVLEDRVLVPEREVRPALHQDEGEVDEDREGQLDLAVCPELRCVERPGAGITVHESAFLSGDVGLCIHRRFSFCCVSADRGPHQFPIIPKNLKSAQVRLPFGDVPLVLLICFDKREVVQ